MEYLRELLTPKTFNRLSHVVVLTWTLFGVILLSIFAAMDNSEPRFACSAKSKNMDLVPEKCLQQYEKRHNKLGVPIYAFVIVNFSVIGIVCWIYSKVVNSRVEQLLEANLFGDAERQRPPETRKLFAAYFCQLTARFTLVILLIVIQTQVLYPANFPSDFSCNLTFAESTSAANASDANIQNTTKIIYECHNQQATKKTLWTNTMSVVNGLFALVILMEIIWILSRAMKRRTFMNDWQFFANHLTKANFVHPLQVELQQEEEQDDMQQERNEIPQEQPLRSLLEMMKESIIEKTEQPSDLKALFSTVCNNSGEGKKTNDLNIDKIYTNLVLHPHMARYYFPEDRKQLLKVYPKPRDLDAENLEPKGPEDIIDTENKKILIIGRPGVGKTLFSTKLLRDWASGNVFNRTQETELDFNIAFLIKFRKLNATGDLSLRELLESAEFLPTEPQLPDEVWNDIVENPDKVLILFDGINELVDVSNIDTDRYRDSVEQKMPLAVLFSELIDDKLLRGATVLTTIRSTAVSSVRHLNFQRTFEILGFAPEQVEEYVENFTKEAAENLSGAGEKIRQHITSNMNLLSFCYVPMNCFTICSILLEVFKFSTLTGKGLPAGGLPVKLTPIYKIATKLFFFRHNEQYRDRPLSVEHLEDPVVEKQFTLLGELAFNGIKERRLVFGSSEVPQDLANSSLFHRMPDLKTGPFKHEAQFCFIHLTIEEFLAAKYITDTMNEAELRTFVSDHIHESEWHIVLQFVAGLLGEQDELLIRIFTDLLPAKKKRENEKMLMFAHDEPEKRTFTCWPTESEKHIALTVIKCVSEGSESKLAVQSKLEDIYFDAVDFSMCSLAPADCTAVVDVLKTAKQLLLINLYRNHIGPLVCVEITKLFDSYNSQLTHLNLGSNSIGDEGVKHLSKALVNCKLTKLNLRYNGISDQGLIYLSDKLLHSKLTKLDLSFNRITDQGLIYLSDKLVNSSLKWLYLSGNSITDKGLIYLSDKLENSKLKWLYLSNNNITDQGLISLTGKIVNSKLKWLNLSGNSNIKPEAKQCIRMANPNCEVII